MLGPQGTITLSVTFTPQSGGPTDGSVFVNGPGLNIPVTGTGTGTVAQLTVAPTTLSFGSVNVGSTATQVAAVTATGGSVTISSAVSSNAQFTIAGASFPLTLNAGQSAQFDVVFSPTGSGADSATLTLSTNCSQPQIIESLTGTGVATQYTVDLSWNPSVSSSIAGYNVYRGTAVGSYTKINSSVDSNTSYTDSTVVAGTTYYYAATAVNSSGEESVYSTPLEVIIP
jgi:hypothetical protein